MSCAILWSVIAVLGTQEGIIWAVPGGQYPQQSILIVFRVFCIEKLTTCNQGQFGFSLCYLYLFVPFSCLIALVKFSSIALSNVVGMDTLKMLPVVPYSV